MKNQKDLKPFFLFLLIINFLKTIYIWLVLGVIFGLVVLTIIIYDDETNKIEPDPISPNDIVDTIPREKHKPIYPNDNSPRGGSEVGLGIG